MLKVAVLVSGGGTNLQAIIDKIEDGAIQNAKIEVVISNKQDAYALERAKKHGIKGECISPKSYDSREAFNQALLEALQQHDIDLVVLAGYLVIIPKNVVAAFKNRIINIHPSLIPSFCGDGFYGLHVHEAVLARGVKVTGATVHFVDDGTDTIANTSSILCPNLHCRGICNYIFSSVPFYMIIHTKLDGLQ